MSGPSGNTRDRILEAGTELFAERGFAASSMRELADRAGVALSASYYHFSGKQDVLVAIMDSAMTTLEAGALGVLERDLDPLPRLIELLKAHVNVHLEEPDRARVADGELRALGPTSRAHMVKVRDRYEEYFRRTLREGLEVGSFAPELDVSVTAMAIITTATSTVDWWRPDGRLSISETAAVVSQLGVAMAVHGTPDMLGVE